MKNLKLIIFGLSLLVFISSCEIREDIGPIQESQKIFQLSGFDKLEVEDAFEIEVIQGAQFSITANGDRRNLDDLIVEVFDEELRIRYSSNRKRKYTTYIYITMPSLSEVDFEGATQAEITGFNQTGEFKMELSGASHADLDLSVDKMILELSGASILSLNSDLSQEILADLSGASVLNAYQAPTSFANIELSGASEAQLEVSDELIVTASGASVLRYRGTASVSSELTGASQVIQE